MNDEEKSGSISGFLQVVKSALLGVAASVLAFIPFRMDIAKKIKKEIFDIKDDSRKRTEAACDEYEKLAPRLDPRHYVGRSDDELVRDATAWNNGLIRHVQAKVGDGGVEKTDTMEKVLKSNFKLFSEVSPLGKLAIIGTGAVTFVGGMIYFNHSKNKAITSAQEKNQSFAETVKQEKSVPQGMAV